MLFVVPYVYHWETGGNGFFFSVSVSPPSLTQKEKTQRAVSTPRKGHTRSTSIFCCFGQRPFHPKIRTEQRFHGGLGARGVLAFLTPSGVRVSAGRFESLFLELKCAHRVFSLGDPPCPPLKRKPQLNINNYSDRTVTRDTFKLSKNGWP